MLEWIKILFPLTPTGHTIYSFRYYNNSICHPSSLFYPRHCSSFTIPVSQNKSTPLLMNIHQTHFKCHSPHQPPPTPVTLQNTPLQHHPPPHLWVPANTKIPAPIPLLKQINLHILYNFMNCWLGLSLWDPSITNLLKLFQAFIREQDTSQVVISIGFY